VGVGWGGPRVSDALSLIFGTWERNRRRLGEWLEGRHLLIHRGLWCVVDRP
jgi:hypothetical protein